MWAYPINDAPEQSTVSRIVTQEQINDFNNRMKGLNFRLRMERARILTYVDPTNTICM